jgi:peptidoglycan hydrolase CwlO-like protein
MDTERTLQFILDNMAALTVIQQKSEIRLARIERQMAGLQTIVKTGMRMMVKLQQGQHKLEQNQLKLEQSQLRLEKSHQTLDLRMAEMAAAQARTDQALAELAVQHKRTDLKFERWLDSMNKGSNGHRKKPN